MIEITFEVYIKQKHTIIDLVSYQKKHVMKERF